MLRSALNTICFVVWELTRGLFDLLIPSSLKPERRIDGETALVTGAAGGLGRSIAIRLAKRGCSLILWDREGNGLEETRAQCQREGAKVVTRVVDLSESEEISEAATELGRVDIVVNNAGVGSPGSVMKGTEAEVRKTLEINCICHYWIARAFLPAMIERNTGHFVTISSVSAYSPLANQNAYSVSKTTAHSLQLALENEMIVNGHDGIRFTTVFPGFFLSAMTERMMRANNIPNTITMDDVADATVRGILRGERTVIIPAIRRAHFALKNLLPLSVINRVFNGM